MTYKDNYLKAHGFIKSEFIPCEVCGAQAVDIHHKVKRSQLGSDDASNLIALCRTCHDKHHR